MRIYKKATLTTCVGLSLILVVTVDHKTPSSDVVIVPSEISPISSPIYSEQTPYSTTEDVSDDEIIEKVEREIISIYLNPSVQIHNLYTNGLGTEAEHMNDIANIMYDKLKDIYYLEVDGNLAKNGLSLSKSLAESNSKSRHIHFSLHSNAGGGKGTEIYTKGSDKRFASTMYENFFNLKDLKRRGIKDGTHLYEVKTSKAQHVALMEIAFHDNLDEAKFIIGNKDEIASNLVRSMLEFIDLCYPVKSIL